MGIPLLLCLAALSGGEEDTNVVVFGGGWGPEGNQSSIEADAGRLTNLFDAKLLFARGDASRTVQTASAADAVSARLGLLFGRSEALDVHYRPTQLAPKGPATSKALRKTLSVLARRRTGGVVFGAGHGSPALQDEPATLDLWGDSLDVTELAKTLDASGARGSITFVLGQCHSGAFADIVHIGGHPKAPLARPIRCVLAAAPAHLDAAGCSPDADLPESKAFLHMIAKAYEKGADFDRDGSVGLDEAFAYARIHDATIDVPVRSSEVWLRRQLGMVDLRSTTREELYAHADPGERAILETLIPAGSPEALSSRFQNYLRRAKKRNLALQAREDRFENARNTALDVVFSIWPELTNPYHSKARALLAGAAPELMALWTQPEIKAMEQAHQQWLKAQRSHLSFNKDMAILNRWLRTARSVEGRRNLNRPARKRLELLRTCERRPLTPVATSRESQPHHR